MSYFRPAKKQKLQESSSITLPSNIKTKKHNFSIEINSNSKNNSNQDTPSWIQYDLTQTNEQLDLFGFLEMHHITNWGLVLVPVYFEPDSGFRQLGLGFSRDFRNPIHHYCDLIFLEKKRTEKN